MEALGKGRVVAQRCDVTVQDDVDALFATAADAFGAVDVVINNASLGRPAEVWEVANVMVFLASDYASYMTGETVAVSRQRA